MTFGRLRLSDALGAVLGHTQRLGPASVVGVIKKGRRLTERDLAALAAAGHTEVIAARIDEEDVAEDVAADRVAAAVAGEGARAAAATTGRSNLFALADGLVRVDAARVHALNLVDEAVTLATVASGAPVRAGDMIATVKIIPYAVPRSIVAACETAARAPDGATGVGAITVAAFRSFRAGLVLTRLPGVHESVIDRAAAAQRARVERLGGEVAMELRCAHDEAEVAAAIRALLAAGCSPVLALGASAIADRRDVIPAAIALAGGVIEHFGMPVDPGNLMLLGRLGSAAIVGVPGCARSLRRSGFDMVLERIAAGIAVTREDIARMGVGGLLMEIPSRPTPPSTSEPVTRALHPVGAVVLAAGHSRRMGERNKLLVPVAGEPMVARVVGALLATRVRPVVVVTGHDAEAVRQALAGRPVRFVHNAGHEAGMSGSLRAGIEALGEAGVHGALVCLGDMPRIGPQHIEALLAAFAPVTDEEGGDVAAEVTVATAWGGREAPRPICVPTFEGRRGNPVLFARRYFDELCALRGDVGARAVIERHVDVVRRVPVEDDGVLIDIDTPETLAAVTQEEY